MTARWAVRAATGLPAGNSQKSLIFDWGIVAFRQPLRSKSKILTTSPYTGEARASRSILLDKHQFTLLTQHDPVVIQTLRAEALQQIIRSQSLALLAADV